MERLHHEKNGICNNKDGVFADMGLRVLLVDMDQQGSLSSSFFSSIHGLSPVVTDVFRDKQVPTKTGVHSSNYQNIDILPANLSLTDLETEQVEAFRRLGTKVLNG